MSCFMDKKLMDDALAFVRNTFQDDAGGHDYFHTLRVYKMAVRIAEQENADITIVSLAALLHDVDDIKLSPETYANKDRAAGFLREHGTPEAMIKAICHMIDQVSFRGTDSTAPDTIEGKCVQDADRLDAMGAVGIARAFAYGGAHGRVLYDPGVKPAVSMNAEEYRSHVSTTVNHFYEKLFQLKDLMNTGIAKRIAGHREAYMRSYLSEFLNEWDGAR